MRLHLNKTLRAALIAAFTAVGSLSLSAGSIAAIGAALLAGQQAQAELQTLLTMDAMAQAATVKSANISTTWEIVNGGPVYDFDRAGYLGGIDASSLISALDGGSYITVSAWINSTTHGKSKDGHSIFGYGGQGDGVKVIDQDGYLKLTTKAVKDYDLSTGTVDLGEWELMAVTIHKDGNDLEIQYVLDGEPSTTIKYGNSVPSTPVYFAIGSGNGSGNIREGFDGSIGNLTVFTSDGWSSYNEVSSLMGSKPTEKTFVSQTWAGDGTNHKWNDTVWLNEEGGQCVAFANGDAVFGATGNAVVDIASSVTAHNVTVSGQDYTFSISNGGSLTAKRMTVTDHTLALGDASYNIGSLEISDGAVVTTTRSNGTAAVTGDIVINEGGTFKVLGGHDAFGYEGGQTDNIIMTGSANHLATLELHQTTNNSVTMQTNIQMRGYSRIVDAGSHHKGFNTYGGNISITGTNNTIDHMSMRKPVVVDVANGGDLVITTLDNDTHDATRNLTKTGAGSMTVTNSSATFNELYLNGGTLTFATGTTTVNGKLINDNVAVNSLLVIGTDAQHTAILKVNRLENGNVNNSNVHSDVTINTGSTLKITGSSEATGYKNASLVLGEWNVNTTANINGTLIADQASLVGGDSGYIMNINGGTVLVKGLRRNESKNPNHRINISNGGSLILGTDGIVASNAGNGGTTTVNGGTIGIYADSVAIDKNIILDGAATFDTQKYTVNDITVEQGQDGGTLTISGIISGTGSLIKTGTGTLTLSGANTYTGDTVVKGGTLDIQGSISAQSKVKVEESATLAGNTENISVGIAAGQTATITDARGFTPKDSGVTFISDSGEVKVQNTGDAEITYGIDQEAAKVTADILVVESETDVTVKNKVVVGDIANIGEGNLTLTHVDVIKPLKGVYAHDGALTLQNITEVSVVEMEIASGSTVAVYTSENADVEGTVTITEKLEAGGGTLLANLKMANGSKLALSLMNGGGMQALTLGSQFTIAEGALVRLDDATLEAIAGLTEGQEVILIKALQENGHELTSNLQNGALASLYFNGVDAADYTMVVNANEIAIKKAGAIPEPTTGTLSLLALAALAARRRRK